MPATRKPKKNQSANAENAISPNTTDAQSGNTPENESVRDSPQKGRKARKRRVDPPQSASRARKSGQTERKLIRQEEFLKNYANTGNVRFSAAQAGVSDTLHFRWLESDPIYVERYQAAHDQWCDLIRQTIRARAVMGVVRAGGFWKGKQATWVNPETKQEEPYYVREYSDLLLAKMAEANLPEYERNNKLHLSGRVDGGGVIVVPAPVTADEWSKIARDQQAGLIASSQEAMASLAPAESTQQSWAEKARQKLLARRSKPGK